MCNSQSTEITSHQLMDTKTEQLHTVEEHVAMKRDEVQTRATAWRSAENAALRPWATVHTPGSGPWLGASERQPTDVSLPFSLPPFPSVKINKNKVFKKLC